MRENTKQTVAEYKFELLKERVPEGTARVEDDPLLGTYQTFELVVERGHFDSVQMVWTLRPGNPRTRSRQSMRFMGRICTYSNPRGRKAGENECWNYVQMYRESNERAAANL